MGGQWLVEGPRHAGCGWGRAGPPGRRGNWAGSHHPPQAPPRPLRLHAPARHGLPNQRPPRHVHAMVRRIPAFKTFT